MKKHYHFITAVGFAALFFVLLGIKTGVFRQHAPADPSSTGDFTEKNTWMNIYQNNKKIGYSNRIFKKTSDGYEVYDQTFMRLNIMKMVEDVFIETNGKLKPDFSISSFNFELKSSMFYLTVYGTVNEGTLILHLNGEKSELSLTNTPYLSAGFMDKLLNENLAPGESETLYIFDPSVMVQKPVTATFIGKENTRIMGDKLLASKWGIDFMGARQYVWTNDDGEIVRETGLMGISLEKTRRDIALSDFQTDSSEDITASVSIPSNKILENKEALTYLAVKLQAYGKSTELNGGRQSLKDDILTIHKETIPGESRSDAPDMTDFLSAEPFIESDHPQIKTLIKDITSETDSPYKKIRKIMIWMNVNIDKRPVLSIPSALETFKNKKGDCNEHAVLFCALARASGIPAKIESGLAYLDGRFYYHAWNSLFLNGHWITADASMDQIPADVTHIRLVTGGTDKQVDLISVIGKLKLTILEYRL